MPTPIATLTNTTATGDIISGPGAPTRLVKGMPVACLTNAVAGTAVVGVLTATTAVTKLKLGLPTANLTAVVSGANPITGVPVTMPLALCPNVNRIV